MNEIWKPIKESGGRYEVSNAGRVRSFARKNNPGRIIKGQILKGGYRVVHLQINGGTKPLLVHRLVATAFIPNPKSLPQVNHKDENKQNNFSENLEWCTAAENLAYGTAPRRRQLSRSKPCIGEWSDGTIRRYESTMQAERETGISHGHIGQVCNGVWRSAGKVKWRWEE